MPSRIYLPEDPEVVNSNTILKHILKKKYDWVIDVNLLFITVRESRTDRDYNEIVLDGVIKVDEDWYGNQWREYNYNFPIPDPNDDRDVVLGELLGGELAMKFNSECRKAITLSLKRQIQGLFWSSLVVRTEEVKKEDMTESIRRILREEFDIYNSENYLEDFYAMDFMEEMYNEEEALRLIQKQIDYVQDIKYPLKVYRGIDIKNPQEDYSGVHWTTDFRVAEGFGDKIFVGLITNQDSIDIEQTIRTRVMNPYEYEITVPNFDDVKILDIYNI